MPSRHARMAANARSKRKRMRDVIVCEVAVKLLNLQYSHPSLSHPVPVKRRRQGHVGAPGGDGAVLDVHQI